MAPPIPLEIPTETKKEKGEFIKVDLKSNPNVADSKTYSFSIGLLYKATPEEILKFMDNFDMIVRGQDIKGPGNKYGMMRNLLRGDALRVFDQGARTFGEENAENFAKVTNKLIEYFFPSNALVTQKRYMRRFMRKSRGMTIREFYVRTFEINNRCAKFPPFKANLKMQDDEIKEIIEFAAPQSWQRELLKQGVEVTSKSLEELVDFFERLETSEQIYGSSGNKKTDEKTGQKATEGDSLEKRGANQPAHRRSSSSRRKKRKFVAEGEECPIHGYDHPMGECKLLMDQGRKMRAAWLARKRDPHPKGYRKYRDDKRDKERKNHFKLNKQEINEIAEKKKSSSPGSDTNSDNQERSEASSSASSDDSSLGNDLYNFERLNLRAKDD